MIRNSINTRLIYFFIAVVIALPAATVANNSELFHPVKISGREGMIVSQEFLRTSGQPAEGFWTPLAGDLKEVERSLPKFLRKEATLHGSTKEFREVVAKANRSRRQYIGLIENGRKLLWINCIPEKPRSGDDPFADWNRKIIDVSDGGSDFWGIIYDMKAHTFEKLIVNGTA